MKYIILLFLVFGKLSSQNIQYVGFEKSKDFSFYRVFKQKCPGYISHNDCLRFIDFSSSNFPKRNIIYECEGELIFRRKLNDTIIAISNVDEFIDRLKIENQEAYQKMKNFKSYNFDKWKLVKMVDNKKFKVYKYSSINVNFHVFKIKNSYLNEILEGNIIIKKPELDDYIFIKIPAE